MISRITFAFGLGALLALSACEDKKTDTGAAASASAALSAAASASAAPSAAASAAASSGSPSSTAAADPNAVPSHTDEAQKAAREIDKANYKSELDKLDKEIGK